MENNNLFNPASEAQINYLKRLGYTGNTEGMTSSECSTLIQQLVKAQSEDATKTNTKKETPKPTTTMAASGTVNAIVEKNISDKVINQISNLVDNQGLVLPKNYNPTNALKSAYLKLAENNLLNTDQTALAEALLNMCIQGLNPAKNQCYFINYGGKVNMMRSYFGDRTVAINTGLVKDVQANVIYEGDEVNVFYENDYIKIEHKTNWENLSNPIKGAYAFAILPDGSKRYDIMTIDRIKKSWSMSKNQTNNKLQTQFNDDACKRTVIRHLVKMIFNETGDSEAVVESYNKTTADEYDNSKEYEHNNNKEVIDIQVEKTGKKSLYEDSEVMEDDTI